PFTGWFTKTPSPTPGTCCSRAPDSGHCPGFRRRVPPLNDGDAPARGSCPNGLDRSPLREHPGASALRRQPLHGIGPLVLLHDAVASFPVVLLEVCEPPEHLGPDFPAPPPSGPALDPRDQRRADPRLAAAGQDPDGAKGE